MMRTSSDAANGEVPVGSSILPGGRFVTQASEPALFEFPPDMARREAEPNRLDNQLLVRTFVADPEVVRDFAGVLFGWTRGNAFFAREILLSLVASGRISHEGDHWSGWNAVDFELPASVRDAIRVKIW